MIKGKIRGTEGTDGDKLDVYVGDNHDSSLVVVIHQHNPWDGQYDEDKVILGCESVEEAIGLYKKQYDRPGFYREGEHTAMPIGAFWRWVNEERNKGKKVKIAHRTAGTAPTWKSVPRLDGAVVKGAEWVKWVRITSTGQMGETVARRMPNGWNVQYLRSGQKYDPKAPVKGRPKKDADIIKLFQEQGGSAPHIMGEAAAIAPPPAPAPVAPKAPVLTVQEQREREEATKRSKGQNPFLYNPWGKPENGWQVGFYVPGKSEPLWWTGSGFKNLAMVRSEPEMFKTRGEAEHKVRGELIKFIDQWRSDQVHLVVGWSGPATPHQAPAIKPPPTPEPVSRVTSDEVASFLRSMSTPTGGRNRDVDYYPPGRNGFQSPHWSAEPANRQRLDHYVGSNYWPGEDDDPEGWDSEGWEEEYAGPLRQEVQDKLDARFGKGLFSVDIGEKGHIGVDPTKKGLEALGLGGKTAMWKKGYTEGKPGAINAAKVMLSNLLAYLRALGWNHQTSHWQVGGDASYGDHLLFERLYGQVVGETDKLAEKLVGLFGIEAVNGAEQAKLMAFAMHNLSEIGCPFERGLKAEQTLQTMFQKTLAALEDIEQLGLGLDNLLRTMADEHETAIYLLQQRQGGVKIANVLNPEGRLLNQVVARHMLKKLAGRAAQGTLLRTRPDYGTVIAKLGQDVVRHLHVTK